MITATLWAASACLAGEHAGKEHAGKEHAGEKKDKDKWVKQARYTFNDKDEMVPVEK